MALGGTQNKFSIFLNFFVGLRVQAQMNSGRGA